MSELIRSIPSYFSSLTSRRQIADLSQQVDRASKEISTGLKTDIYQALGRRSAEAIELHGRAERNAGFLSSNSMLRGQLETVASGLSGIRGAAQEFLDLAVGNRGDKGPSVRELQTAARAALDRIVPQANLAYNGKSVFAGVDSGTIPLVGWTEVNAQTGLSPQQVVTNVIGGGVTDAADAQAKVDQLADIFASAAAAVPGTRFEETFYRGTPLLDGAGNASPRLSARVDERTEVEYGVQANDPAFTDLLRGLAMVAATDVSAIDDPDAYRVWMNQAVDSVSAGIDGILRSETMLGSQQQILERTVEQQETRGDLYKSRLVALEAVDPYEAATRLSLLQSQLEATYAVTARISRMSFLNYM